MPILLLLRTDAATLRTAMTPCKTILLAAFVVHYCNRHETL